MFGDWLDVGSIDRAAVTARRERLHLSKAETARRMFAHLQDTGPAHRGAIALVGDGFAFGTEQACRRAIDDLEWGRRTFKEEHYVDALLAVLSLTRTDVGLSDAGER
jgi:hypothetical protein